MTSSGYPTYFAVRLARTMHNKAIIDEEKTAVTVTDSVSNNRGMIGVIGS
jgi:hypothetical protein